MWWTQMRIFFFLIIVSIAFHSAAAAQERGFRPGDVWEFKDPAYGDAIVVVEAIEQPGETKLVHSSVFGLPGPHRSAILFETIRELSEPEEFEGKPISYVMSGHYGNDGHYSSMSAVLSLEPDAERGEIAIPHIVVYEPELREAVSGLRPVDWSPHSMYDEAKALWEQGEQDWPELLEQELEWPFAGRIDTVMTTISELANDESHASRMGPPPPANATSAELPIEEPKLDEICREIAAPEPLSEDTIASLVAMGMPREDIPLEDITLEIVSINKSEEWGFVWRADARDSLASPPNNVSRVVCWRRSESEQPAVTWYPRSTLQQVTEDIP